jgi:hypothetical protein
MRGSGFQEAQITESSKDKLRGCRQDLFGHLHPKEGIIAHNNTSHPSTTPTGFFYKFMSNYFDYTNPWVYLMKNLVSNHYKIVTYGVHTISCLF